MNGPADWARSYARQADKDLKAWELYEKHPEVVAAECHKLLLLQMACEKLCKAHRIQSGTPPDSVQSSHAVIAHSLPSVIKAQLVYLNRAAREMKWVMDHVRPLAGEIELLNPAVKANGQRPDNCEYPWESGGKIVSPLDWTFHPSHLVTVQAGRTFLKLLRGAIDRILE